MPAVILRILSAVAITILHLLRRIEDLTPKPNENTRVPEQHLRTHSRRRQMINLTDPNKLQRSKEVEEELKKKKKKIVFIFPSGIVPEKVEDIHIQKPVLRKKPTVYKCKKPDGTRGFLYDYGDYWDIGLPPKIKRSSGLTILREGGKFYDIGRTKLSFKAKISRGWKRITSPKMERIQISEDPPHIRYFHCSPKVNKEEDKGIEKAELEAGAIERKLENEEVYPVPNKSILKQTVSEQQPI